MSRQYNSVDFTEKLLKFDKSAHLISDCNFESYNKQGDEP